MPRLPINHANTQIYRFVCNDVNITNTYVGSTTNWSHRKGNHKSACNNPNNRIHHLNVYQVIRANGGWDNWNMVLVEDFPCNGKREAEQREQYWKEQYNDDMGTYRAFRTEEQRIEQKADYSATHNNQRADYNAKYSATHKEQIAEQKAKYRAINREQIAEQNAQYYATNRDQIAEQKAKYRAINREQIAEQNAQYYAQYYATNRDQINLKKRQARATNRDQINLKRRQARALKKLKL